MSRAGRFNLVCSLRRSTRRWPVTMVEEWRERAAIREFDGHQDRHDAERAAWEDVTREAQRGRR